MVLPNTFNIIKHHTALTEPVTPSVKKIKITLSYSTNNPEMLLLARIKKSVEETSREQESGNKFMTKMVMNTFANIKTAAPH